MFLLKEQKQNQPSSFDESHLDVKISHGRSQLQQIKVVHSWTTSSIKVRLPKLSCQWFNKTQSSMELISGVNEDSYQPSIIDVGTSIYVQVIPESQELEYEGMPISRYTTPIQLAAETEEQAKQLLEAGKSTFFIELKELYLKGLDEQDQEAVDGKVPIKECLLKIVHNKVILLGRTTKMEKADVLLSGEIGNQYPQLQIDRSCGRFLNILFNAEEYAIVIVQNNKIRDILYLLVKTIQQKQAQHQKIKQAQLQNTPSQRLLIQPKVQIKQCKQKTAVEDSLNKKQEECLPLSPQTIQKQVNQSANIIIISELRHKLMKSELDCNKYYKEVLSQKEKISSTTQLNNTLTKDISIAQQKMCKLEQDLKIVNEYREKQKEQMCYLKNQCRILDERNAELTQQSSKLRAKLAFIEESFKLSEEEKLKFGEYSTLKLQDALNLVLKQQHEIEECRLKNDYLEFQIQKFQEEINQSKDHLEKLQASNKHLSRKVQSLMQAQSKINLQASNQEKEEIQALNFLISKQKEEQAIIKSQVELLQKQKNSMKLQVKELIEENTCWRSKEKSSKHDLKLQVVELKKLVNKFTEMITEKDVEIENLKLTNKTLNKALLEAKK